MATLTYLMHFLQNPSDLENLTETPWVRLALFILAASILIYAGIRKKSQLGILLVLALIFIASRVGLTSLAQIGFVPPENWLVTLLGGLLGGIVLSLFSIIVIQPLIETFTQQPHDVGIVATVRENWKTLLSWLVLIWTFVAFGEELLFHGFLMSQLIELLGIGPLALVINALLCNVVFGLSHAYQGRSGIWSTGIIGLCLSGLYILSGFNLWLPIVTHGVIDTVELLLMSRGLDQPLRELIWKRPLPRAN